MSSRSGNHIVGEVDPSVAFDILKNDRTAQLIDVRTRAEWTFVGVPDLSTIGKRVLPVEWQAFPPASLEADFIDAANDLLKASGATADAKLFFLCRSGARSLAAARAMTAAGWRACFNITDGFEGPPDVREHRGTLAGWKVAGLPWRQG